MARITRGQIGGIYAIAARLGWDNDRLHDTVYDNYHVEHISQLTAEQAAELIGRLKQNQNSTDTSMDVWRKRLMAAVGAYLRAFNYTESPAAIKAIACRAAGMPNADCFNQIPLDRLRGLYNAFRNAARDRHSVDNVTEELAAAAALAN